MNTRLLVLALRSLGEAVVDTRGKSSNQLFDYLSRFWRYYQNNAAVQNVIENAV
jgi:hypothetical protein